MPRECLRVRRSRRAVDGEEADEIPRTARAGVEGPPAALVGAGSDRQPWRWCSRRCRPSSSASWRCCARGPWLFRSTRRSGAGHEFHFRDRGVRTIVADAAAVSRRAIRARMPGEVSDVPRRSCTLRGGPPRRGGARRRRGLPVLVRLDRPAEVGAAHAPPPSREVDAMWPPLAWAPTNALLRYPLHHTYGMGCCLLRRCAAARDWSCSTIPTRSCSSAGGRSSCSGASARRSSRRALHVPAARRGVRRGRPLVAAALLLGRRRAATLDLRRVQSRFGVLVRQLYGCTEAGA